MALNFSGAISKEDWEKFNVLNDEKFIFRLKEIEFRFNNGRRNLYKVLLKIIRENLL